MGNKLTDTALELLLIEQNFLTHMDYKKEELTEYNGERGYWRTINGRKIFISIEDTKQERKGISK